MRVIAGKARRIQLETVKGDNTRPTTDRIKETLFNMINNRLWDVDFLDLFSGSGGIGIEALSRGARSATFIENNRNAAKCISNNLIRAHFEEQAELIINSVSFGLKSLNNKKRVFDIVFMDPPYDKQLEKEVLIFLSNSNLINEDSLIIVEASLHTDFEYVEQLGYKIKREKRYKTNKHLFLQLVGE